MQFKIGDKVIYPNQGVGVIQEVCQRKIGGQRQKFYLLKITSNNSRVMIPIANVDHVGLRRLCNEKQLESLFDILRDDYCELDQDWKNRYKENIEKMRTGSIFEVATVLRNLYFLSLRKALSFREKKMFDRARELVVSEIAMVRDKPAKEVEDLIETLLTSVYERMKTGTA